MDTSFRTPYRPQPSAPLDLHKPVLMTGSCFTDNVGGQLRRRMVNVSHNPAGTLFNPQSICNVINAALDGVVPEYEDHGGLWNSWLLPGEFSSPDRDEAVRLGTDALARLADYARTAGTLIVPFGTAIVYALARPPFAVVSNCHKQPQAIFFRDLLTVETVTAAWDALITRLRSVNPSLRIIFTVSPVLHLKEGFHANAVSKSVLLLAVDRITSLHADCEYFPAYEIFSYDLRDYRFYADDMQHPSPAAVAYIYDLFEQTYVAPDDRKTLARALNLRQRTEHRPLHPETEAARRFADDTASLLRDFLSLYPYLHF